MAGSDGPVGLLPPPEPREREGARESNAKLRASSALVAVPVAPPRENGESPTTVAASRLAEAAAAIGDQLTLPNVVEPPPETKPAKSEPKTIAIPPIGTATLEENIGWLAARIVDAQKPLRVLNSLRWDSRVDEALARGKFKDLPAVGPSDYADLGFDAIARINECEAIARDVETRLGEGHPIGSILIATALDYRDVIRMLLARGTPDFYVYSRRLYGSPKDRLPHGKTVRDVCSEIYGRLGAVGKSILGPEDPRDIPADEAAAILDRRLREYFVGSQVAVQIDDSIAADAAAGSDYVKLRSGARFSQRDIDILEVHEGWVHLATSLNGQSQPVARWLSKGPPRTIAVQEGLAALVELFTFRSSPRRARRINDRVLAVDMAEDGASFADVFEWFRTAGYTEEDCVFHTRRVFRGGTLAGGAPFTKDALYGKGILLNYAFVYAAIHANRPELIPYLFVGKVAHEDVPVLYEHSTAHGGFVAPPVYVPPMFRDRSGLATWIVYSDFLSGVDGGEIIRYFDGLVSRE
ncbi:MAG: flavohemoglobin expression-modulating QEGLA motif protein [Polyangiaceae bacterium]